MAKKILFIHHSTGGNLLHQGKVRQLLAEKAPELELWDHGYNLYKNVPPWVIQPVANILTFHTGLSDQHGQMTGRDFNIQLGNNNPHDYTKIFTADPQSRPLREILQYDIIMFKNCYPATKIETDAQLQRYKEAYLKMRAVFEQYPKKLFIPFTPPPLREELTTIDCASRARRFADWLMSAEFHQNNRNIKIFDFFSLLADDDGFLKKGYRRLIHLDSHPNTSANHEIAPILVNFLLEH